MFHVKHSITYHDVPRETFSATDTLIAQHRGALDHYIDRLLWWNERLNLVSRDVSRETITEHVRHSLLLSAFPSFADEPSMVDAGTGGGLPGLPLAITHPDKHFLLNDIVSKKMLAVKQMVRSLDLENVTTFDKTVGAVPIEDPFPLITKHAFKINQLIGLLDDKPWTTLTFYKGADFEQELEGLQIALDIEVHALYPHSSNEFYRDKTFVIVRQ